MDILFWVLTALILLVLLWVVFLLSFQFVFILCGFLKPKVFPKAKVLRKFAIIIPAHNESSVIGDSVKYLLHELGQKSMKGIAMTRTRSGPPFRLNY